MPNAKDLQINTEFIKCLILGESGTGKSIFAASCPGPAYVFDFDHGMLSYRNQDFDYYQKEGAKTTGFSYTPEGWYEFLVESAKVLSNPNYKTIVVDSVTFMQEAAMQRAMAMNPQRKNDGPVWNIHYDIVKNLVKAEIRKILNYNGNVVVIGHVKPDKDENSGQIFVRPNMIGQLRLDLPGYFDEVLFSDTRTVAGTVQYRLQTVATGYYHARSRLSGKERLLPDFVPNDYAEIMKYIKGEKKNVKATTPTQQPFMTK